MCPPTPPGPGAPAGGGSTEDAWPPTPCGSFLFLLERGSPSAAAPPAGGGSQPPDHRGRGRAPERPEHLKSHRPDQSSPSESERETLTHGHRGHHLGGHLPTEPSQHKTGGLCVSPTAAVTNGRRWSGLQQHTLTFFLSRGEDQPHWAKVGYAGVGRAGLFWGPSGRIHLYALFSAARGLAVCTPWLVAPSSRTSLQPLLLPHLYELRPLT